MMSAEIDHRAVPMFVRKQKSALIFIKSSYISEFVMLNTSCFYIIQFSGLSSIQKSSIARKVHPTLNEDILKQVVDDDTNYHGFQRLNKHVNFIIKKQNLGESIDTTWFKSDLEKPRPLQIGKLNSISLLSEM